MNDRFDHTQPGLALRMQRETRVISAQHRQLDEFYGRVRSSLAKGETDAARAAFARFADALEAHLALEDGLYFPALRGLRPALEQTLERLCDEHERLRERLAAVARRIETTESAENVRALDAFAGELAEHEGREEQLLASIQNGGERS